MQRRLRRLSLRVRIGALAALSVGLAVTLTALATYLTVSSQLTQSVDDNLIERAQEAVSTPLGEPSTLVQVPAEAILAADLRIAIVGFDDTGSNAWSAQGEESAPPLGEPELAVARGSTPHSVRTAELQGDSYRVVAVPAGPGLALVLAQSTEPTERTLDRLQVVSFVVGGLGILVAAWAGVSITQAGLRPVRRLTDAAEHVARTQRLDPIDVDGNDEIARLAHAFNAMLAALNDARLRQARLVADAGHELRTPLTSMRTNLDLLEQSDRQGGLDADERAQLIADVRAQAEELSQLMGDLVELSREDRPQSASSRVDLADVVRDALSRVQRRAPGVTFSADLHSWMVDGDAQLLGRAITNLLDNAAKYSPANGTVTVTLRDGTIDVCDEGPGIADEDLPHVFERFYRSSEARGRPGSGLGLAIVRTAAERHGGHVYAGRAPSGGARLTMSLPSPSSRSLA
ncbi:sensor histidine kinase [Actinobacteria bacterium YIM 96077]|uniref:histidine kinase n=1 Tax=Phytoactinopolyspora halophila TaxID=1981511 RepID=A0A329QJD0_9ACTN|nr:sensor histidine kinase [Actinobacteria bacterium YIM 96077]RAW12424.1 two-component sensor histidine kinase [Phytoactinopolyspora halophila]